MPIRHPRSRLRASLASRTALEPLSPLIALSGAQAASYLSAILSTNQSGRLALCSISPGMNMFNVKAKLVPAGARKLRYVPAVSVGGVLRTNDPFVVQSVQHTNATNGDVYGVATELFAFGRKFAFLGTGGVRGTNAQKYGYGGNTLDWQARAFGGLAFPIPIRKAILIAPTVEVDQEPRFIKYVPTAHLPTDLIYAVRVSRYPDSKWTFDVGTGHVGATLAQGINIKVNNAIAFAADFRF